MRFLYRETESFYGREGQASIDPVVFFKLLLVGYLNNLNSDRKLVQSYRSSVSDFRKCPLRAECCGAKTNFKKIDDSIYKEHYDRMHKKLTENPEKAKRMSKIRSKTVEPVLGTLLNYLGMRRVNTRGIQNANKHVLMAALCYNLKKLLKWNPKTAVVKAEELRKLNITQNKVLIDCFWPARLVDNARTFFVAKIRS